MGLTLYIMAVGKNKRLSKGKKGLKKRVVDPFTRKEWFDIKAPTTFENRAVGKTLINKSTGLKNAADGLKGRVIEVNLADLQGSEDHAYKKVKLRVDEVQGKNLLTNFHGIDFTSDKLRSLVRKWQSLVEANVTVKTAEDYLRSVFQVERNQKEDDGNHAKRGFQLHLGSVDPKVDPRGDWLRLKNLPKLFSHCKTFT